jgi:hypothetical protein
MDRAATDRAGGAFTLCVLILVLVGIVELVGVGSIVAGCVLGPAFILVVIGDLHAGPGRASAARLRVP